MKTRLVLLSILLLVIGVFFTKNKDSITNTLVGKINPVKQEYKSFIDSINNKIDSFFYQNDSINKLTLENQTLRQNILNQKHYLQQVKNIYEVLPQLPKYAKHNISISETISYVELHSFSKIIMTKPKGLEEDRYYGLIQDNVAAGTSHIENGQLYGYLTSDNRCRFSIFIGDKLAPGIAIGNKSDGMIIKFIPKWHDIQPNDKVVTSGLDNIFFANIPVGVVTKVEIQSSYKVAHIKTYNDIYHPKTFFLINNSTKTVAEGFENNDTKISPIKTLKKDNNKSNKMINNFNQEVTIVSSIPARIDQTQEDSIQPDIPTESDQLMNSPKVKKVKRKTRNKRRIKRTKNRTNKKRVKRKPRSKVRTRERKKAKLNTLDFF